MKMRLHKILARSTELSLRAAEKAIANGEVSVNGKVVTMLGSFAEPGSDTIKWKGRTVRGDFGRKAYLIYYKPKNTLVTKLDVLGRRTIWSDLKEWRGSLNAVGRLDYQSEGLLILTNDGELINKLTHPKFHIEKVYNVKVRGEPTEEQVERIRKGIVYKGVKYQPAGVRLKSTTEKHRWADVTITEGRNRQIRNMFAAIGHPVLKLKRVAVGPVRLGGLQSGRWRAMRRKELESLLVLVQFNFDG